MLQTPILKIPRIKYRVHGSLRNDLSRTVCMKKTIRGFQHHCYYVEKPITHDRISFTAVKDFKEISRSQE